MIKSADLLTLWSAPDNSRLTPKQYSFRLPTHVAAKIAALEEMYPKKSRTEIVGDLLSAALEELEAAFPKVDGSPVGQHPDSGETLYEDAGPRREYRDLADKHYIQIERDLGNEDPKPLYGMHAHYRNAREALGG